MVVSASVGCDYGTRRSAKMHHMRQQGACREDVRARGQTTSTCGPWTNSTATGPGSPVDARGQTGYLYALQPLHKVRFHAGDHGAQQVQASNSATLNGPTPSNVAPPPQVPASKQPRSGGLNVDIGMVRGGPKGSPTDTVRRRTGMVEHPRTGRSQAAVEV